MNQFHGDFPLYKKPNHAGETMPLSQEDQVALKKYVGPDYVKFNSILRGRADKLFLTDGAIDTAKLSTLFSGEYGGFRGLMDECIKIVRALSHLPVYGGDLATRGVNNYVTDGRAMLFSLRQKAISNQVYREPAFMSTTAGNCMWPRDILVVADLTTSSAHGGRMLPASVGGYAAEGECLFLPSSPFKITGAEEFSWSTHGRFIDEAKLSRTDAEAAFKYVLNLQALDYPAAELDPATSTWYLGGQNYAREFEQRARGELIDLSMRDDQFDSAAVITDTLQAATSKFGLRQVLNAMRASGDMDNGTFERLTAQNKVTDADLRALSATIADDQMPAMVKRSILGI